MCVKYDALKSRGDASRSLLAAVQRFGIGEGLRHTYPVDPVIPEQLRVFLERL